MCSNNMASGNDRAKKGTQLVIILKNQKYNRDLDMISLSLLNLLLLSGVKCTTLFRTQQNPY